MYKAWTIAWRELYTTFTDRNLIVIMILSPLAISTIVALAFSRIGGGDVPVQDIPIAVLNQDEGNAYGANFGQVYVSALVPDAPDTGNAEKTMPACESFEGENAQDESTRTSLFDLTEAIAFDATMAAALVEGGDVDAPEAEPGSDVYVESVAKRAVDNGIYTTLILIPPNFTQNLSYVPALHPELEETGVTVYANSGRPIASEISRSIADGITNQIATGNIAMAATFAELEARYSAETIQEAMANLDSETAFACAFSSQSNTIRLDTQAIGGSSGGNTTVDILVSIGSAQAMFFALFTAQFGVLSLHDERRNWTLQRLVMSPTPRAVILGGKLVGVFVTVLFQLSILLLALTVVGSIVQGELVSIWGPDLGRILLVLLAAALAVAGYGMFTAGIVKTPEQGQIIGSIITFAMAVLGGAFGFRLPEQVSQLSLVYWGREAFDLLAAGQGAVGLNVLVLVLYGVVLYLIGLMLFSRRLEI